MYHLLFRISNGLEPLRKKFEDHVKRAGLEAVQKVLPAPGAVSEAGKAEVLVSWFGHSLVIELTCRIPNYISKPCWRFTKSMEMLSTVLSEQSLVSMLVWTE